MLSMTTASPLSMCHGSARRANAVNDESGSSVNVSWQQKEAHCVKISRHRENPDRKHTLERCKERVKFGTLACLASHNSRLQMKNVVA